MTRMLTMEMMKQWMQECGGSATPTRALEQRFIRRKTLTMCWLRTHTQDRSGWTSWSRGGNRRGNWRTRSHRRSSRWRITNPPSLSFPRPWSTPGGVWGVRVEMTVWVCDWPVCDKLYTSPPPSHSRDPELVRVLGLISPVPPPAHSLQGQEIQVVADILPHYRTEEGSVLSPCP